MIKWNFPSRNNGQIEGFSNPGLAWFKGDPLQALAREICQNSLDAVNDENEPVRVEFKRELVKTINFPGTIELLSIIRNVMNFGKTVTMRILTSLLTKLLKFLRVISFLSFE